jgi:hypothetical protein
VLHLSRGDIRVQRRGQIERVIRREKVDAVYRRGSKVVIETASGRELFTGDVEGNRASIGNAFVRHGYPWEGTAHEDDR